MVEVGTTTTMTDVAIKVIEETTIDNLEADIAVEIEEDKVTGMTTKGHTHKVQETIGEMIGVKVGIEIRVGIENLGMTEAPVRRGPESLREQ